MDERTVTMMEGVAREWRVRVQDAAGNVLDPAGFSFYGAAADGVQVPRRMQVRVEGDVVVLRLPGLWMSGRCWRYQLMCQDVLTGVEWVLCHGDVVLERRVACNGPALHEDAVLVDAVLDSEMTQVDVVLGDSTAATGEAARLAVAARAGADEAAARAAGDAERVEELKRVMLDVAAGAVLSAEGAEDAKRGAEAAAGAAAADARLSEVAAAEAEVSREAAEAAARGAQGKAAEADASAKVAADAASDALEARDGAQVAQRGAEAAQVVAEDASAQAGRYAEQAVVASDGAVFAQGKAEAAQVVAEAKAAEAAAAAEAVLQPESVAVQAARPAVLLLVREELLGILGDAALFDLDTDGQKIIVHTDRLSEEQLAAVEDMLGRYVPGFVEVVRYNHNMEISWREINKYAACETVEDVVSVNADYRYDVPSDGRWVYPLPRLKNAYDGVRDWGLSGLFSDYRGQYLDSPLCFADLYLPLCTSADYLLYENRTVKEVSLSMPALRKVQSLLGGRSVKKAKLYLPEVTTVGFATIGNPLSGLTDLEVYWPKFETQKGNFLQSAKLNKASAIQVFKSLPTWADGEHKVTIGIHVDHKTDEEVIAAISEAETRGWKLTVQWNPDGGEYVTPASAKYSLRRSTIFARVVEYDGERVLDWGHYVTDPTGYEEFSSVEAAAEYFGIQLETENN